MKGISYKEFYRQLIARSEIEFSYHGIEYMFTKTPVSADATSIELSICSGDPLSKCCFAQIADNTADSIRRHIDNMVNAPIFPDNKSIIEAQKDIEVTCIFG